MLTEQKLSLTGLVDPEKMKELGQIYGVDAFIFGTERTEAGKASVAVTPGAEPTKPLDKIAYAATNSLGQAQELKVNTIAIGNLIGAPPELSEKLSIRLTQSGRFKVIDRSKLELILKEQRLSLTGIIAPEKMKELGKLYGIDAFIFGRKVESSRYPWGNSISYYNANYEGTGGRDRWESPSPVGSFPPNGYGLYDVAGNVWEWVADWYDEYYYRSSPERNPKGPASGKRRVLRGGAWRNDSYALRCANRFNLEPSFTSDFVG